jgi:hypothetical protein
MRELPAPLPPGERTIGQFIGETMRAFGNDFWRLLPAGLPLALADQLCVGKHSIGYQALVFWLATPLFAAAFVWVCAVVLKEKPTRQAFLVAFLIYLPFPALRALFVLPGIAWFAYAGLAVPAALVEGRHLRDAFARGRELGRADFVHAFGSLACLVIVVGIGEQSLIAVLRSQSHNSQRAALALADVVLSPLLFIGGALLYVDQVARVGVVRRSRRASSAS